jgi:hypothetical protein
MEVEVYNPKAVVLNQFPAPTDLEISENYFSKALQD